MTAETCVYIVDDDFAVRDGLGLVLETAGLTCQAFGSAEDFLENYRPDKPGCLLLDMNMPGLNGLELQAELIRRKLRLPIIFLTGYGDIPSSVRAMKAGAVDFLTKPIPPQMLIERVRAVLQQESQLYDEARAAQEICKRINGLTPRETEIMSLAVSGITNKEIARQLGISHRTVEIHRSRILAKTGAANFFELVHLCEICRLPTKLKP